MKRTTLFSLFIALCLTITAQPKVEKHAYMPGNGHIDLERFIDGIDTKMNINNLSLAELRVLRNGVAARQGFVFTDADLRAAFYTTSWYDSLTWKRYEDSYEHPVASNADDLDLFETNADYPQGLKLSADERAFIQRIDERIYQLQCEYRQDNGAGRKTQFLVNPHQLYSMDPKLQAALDRHAFAIVPGEKIQLFHVYEKNDYTNFPSFITTDLYLQLFHFYFDNTLRDIEQHALAPKLQAFCQNLYNGMKDRDEFCQTYMAVALKLLTDSLPTNLSPEQQTTALSEVEKVMAAQDQFSNFLDYRKVMFPYSLFRPRGHYTRNEELGRYFRAMMWLQSVPMGTDKPQQLRSALVLADFIGNNSQARTLYQQLFEPMTFLFGTPDNITILQVAEEITKTGKPLTTILKNKKLLAGLRKNIEEVGEKQTRIRPKFEYTSHTKINLLPQRYQPDAEVMNEMVDYETLPATKRDVPNGLDIFAAMGNNAAEHILLDELGENSRWEGYLPMLNKMKERMNQTDWNQTVSNRWLSSLNVLTDTLRNYPDFMKTPQWAKKNLNTALASWAELKHDAILYAKQPVGAECGGGGIPEPVVKGYVEPNLRFWQKAVALNYTLEEVLQKYGLMTEKAERIGWRMNEVAEFLLSMSRKELNNDYINEMEYKQMEIIGSQFENISLDLARGEEEFLQGWDDINGPDKSVACVADVYTANADNNPEKSVLYAATGPAYEIYVTVLIGDNLYLMRGAVLSYRELKRPLGEQRLTDEEWQQYLKEHPTEGIPSWMQEITVPLETEPEDNEEMFYSSGC